jgi:hypothetical protein
MKEGLENQPYEGGKNFVNIKDGELISGPKNEKKPYTHLTGRITELDVTDEKYEDKDYKKVTLTIKAGEELYYLGFPLESGYGVAFCSMSPNIDFSKPVSISAGIEKIEGSLKKFGKLFIKQPSSGDSLEKWTNLKWYFTKESPEVPKGEEKKDRTGKYFDFTERNLFFFELLTFKIRPAILNSTAAVDAKKVAKKKGEKTGYVSLVDDLPF